MIKVKFFAASNGSAGLESLERAINDWVKQGNRKIVDIRIAAAAPSNSPKSDGMHVHVMNLVVAVLYRVK